MINDASRINVYFLLPSGRKGENMFTNLWMAATPRVFTPSIIHRVKMGMVAVVRGTTEAASFAAER